MEGRGRTLLIAAAILAIGVVIGGYLLGDGLRRARLAERSVTMRGLAERDVTADLATWNLAFSRTATQLDAAQEAIEGDTQTVRTFFQRAGFPADAVQDAGVSVNSFFDTNRGENVITVRRRMQLRTTDVSRARAAYAQQFALVRGGVGVEDGSGMTYSFTRLNAIKPEMIAQATQDARRGAEQFARDSGTAVGGIRSATQGYFSIGARDGDATGEGADGSRESPFQKVRVVTTIEFTLD